MIHDDDGVRFRYVRFVIHVYDSIMDTFIHLVVIHHVTVTPLQLKSSRVCTLPILCCSISFWQHESALIRPASIESFLYLSVVLLLGRPVAIGELRRRRLQAVDGL